MLDMRLTPPPRPARRHRRRVLAGRGRAGGGRARRTGRVARRARWRDPYFPRQGNGGYDVSHYALTLRFREPHTIAGVARLQARATHSLSRFDLDLMHTLRVSSVTVDGVPAAFAQPAQRVQELVITPRTPVADGAHFVVEVHYGGDATYRSDPTARPTGSSPPTTGSSWPASRRAHRPGSR